MNFRPNFSIDIRTLVVLTRRVLPLALPLAVLLLTACGGSTGSGAASPTFSGVAAVGTPIANGTIKVACATGRVIQGTTDSSGAWKVTLTNQTLPCAVEVSGGTINGVSNAVAYHSMATTAGTVNVTPLTDLVIANLVGNTSLSTWFAGLTTSPSSLSTITTADVNAAVTKLSTALSGLSELSTTNPITVTFTPTSGNTSDDMLTALANAMTSNNTSYSSLLSGVATTTIVIPAGFNNAVTTAYTSTTSGSASISATATTTSQALTVGTAMTSFTPLTPSGGATPYVYSYSGTLPTGLSFSTSTGAVTGTPTATYSSANVVFSVQDAKGVVANTTSTVRFTVGAASVTLTAAATTTAQSLVVGTAMTSFSPLTPSGGTTPYTYSYTGTLPTGLSFSTSTGAVTGTPSATYTAADVVFSVKDAKGVVASTTSTVSFTVAVTPITATATTTAQSLMVGTAMASFSPLTSSGGTTPYTYSHTGTLPTGLSFSTSTGAVTGTPSAIYTAANVVFSVQDANAVVASTTSTVSFTVVAASPAISATANTTAQSLTVGTAMTSFSPLSTSGGDAPYTYSITSGTLPAGLSLNTTTGAITGTPSASQVAANIVFSVKDAYNVVASNTSTVSFTVAALPAGYVYEGGLTWMPISSTMYNYSGATTLCAGTINGTADWRLPTDTELSALYTSGAMNGQGWTLNYTWSSTPLSAGNHYSVGLNNGLVLVTGDTGILYVTCVR